MNLQGQMIRYRAEHNLGQAEAAGFAGISQQTWCNVERGNQKPSRLTEGKIRLLIDREEVKKDESIDITDQNV